MKKVKKGKVAVFTCGLDIAQTETKGTVLLKSAEEMLNFTRGEEEQLEKVRSLILVVHLSRAAHLSLRSPSSTPSSPI